MIELYDADRLLTRRDHSLRVTALLLLLSTAAVASYAQIQYSRLQRLQAELKELQDRVAQRSAAAAAPVASAASAALADLLRQAEQMERDAALGGPYSPTETEGERAEVLRASQWLQRLGLLAQPDVSLHKVEVQRSGAVRVEGLASHTEALNNFVQAWERQDELAQLQPRSIEVKQERLPSQGLRFHLLATLAAPRT